MTPRRRAIVTVGAWVAAWLCGWALIVIGASGLALVIWPQLPWWILPAVVTGALLVSESMEARKMAKEARKEAEDGE